MHHKNAISENVEKVSGDAVGCICIWDVDWLERQIVLLGVWAAVIYHMAQDRNARTDVQHQPSRDPAAAVQRDRCLGCLVPDPQRVCIFMEFLLLVLFSSKLLYCQSNVMRMVYVLFMP